MALSTLGTGATTGAGIGGAVASGGIGAGLWSLQDILSGLFGRQFSWDALRQSPLYQQYMAAGSTQQPSSTPSTTESGGSLPSFQGIPWPILLATLGIDPSIFGGDGTTGDGSQNNGSTPYGGNTPTSTSTLQTLQNLFKNPLFQQLAGLGGQALGTLLNSQAIGRAQEMLGTTANNYGDLGQQGLTNAAPYLGGSAAALNGVLSGSDPWSQLQLNGLIPAQRQLNDLLPSLLQRNFATESPEIQQGLQNLFANSTGGPLGTLLERAQQNINNGGQTADSRDTLSQFQAMQRGATPAMQGLLGGGSGLLQNGGMTSALQSLLNAGTNTFTSGGMTPELQQALGTVAGMLQTGGATGATNALTARGLQLAAPNPLLSMDEVTSQARDEAATRMAQAAEHERGQALARGGGPGATVANGVQNQALADFADQGNRAIAESVRNARTSQQGLQLQQTGLGANMATSGQQLEAQRLAELLNATSNLTATSTGRMGVGGQTALGANTGATQRAATGGNLLEAYNQGSLGAGGIIDAILGLEMGNAKDWGQLLNQGVGTSNSGLQAYVNSLLAGAQGGAQAGTNLGNLYLGNMEGLQRVLAGGANNYGQAAQTLGNLGTNWLNFAGNMYGDIGPVVTQQAGYASQSPWGNFLGNVGAGFGLNGTLNGVTPSTTGTSGTATTTKRNP